MQSRQPNSTSHFLATIMIAGFFISVSSAQCHLKPDSSGTFQFSGIEQVKGRSAKKMQGAVREWASGKLALPPMVFSIFPTDKGVVKLKGVTQVPSLNNLNAVSFVAVIHIRKRAYSYHIDQFYFEDISLSLEDWYRKNSIRSDERSEKNMDMVCRGISSHVSLMLANLTEKLNK